MCEVSEPELTKNFIQRLYSYPVYEFTDRETKDVDDRQW